MILQFLIIAKSGLKSPLMETQIASEGVTVKGCCYHNSSVSYLPRGILPFPLNLGPANPAERLKPPPFREKKIKKYGNVKISYHSHPSACQTYRLKHLMLKCRRTTSPTCWVTHQVCGAGLRHSSPSLWLNTSVGIFHPLNSLNLHNSPMEVLFLMLVSHKRTRKRGVIT